MTIKISRTRLDFGAVGMKNYAETVNALGNATGTMTIDYTLGSVVTATTTGNTTWNVSNPPASGKTGSFTLVLSNGGFKTQTWPSGTKWPGGVAPTLSASGIDVLNFFTTDGGSTWRGMLSIGNAALSVGSAFGYALFGWGLNAKGQLGDGTTTSKSSPVLVGATYDWSSVSAGGSHSLAYKTDGTLWAWGLNANGQLGDGTIVIKINPIQVGNLSNWSSISAGFSHSLAYKTDGTIWAWGFNGDGELGDGTTINKSSPTQIGTLTDWASVSGGKWHSLARKTDGTLWAWGYNFNSSAGVLGDSTVVSKSSPTKIGTLTDWASVSAGVSHSLARKTDGTIWAWGDNTQGRLGDSTTTNKSSPVKIGTLTNWASVSAGYSHSLAYKTDGTIWSWGYNGQGQLGFFGDNWSSVAAGRNFSIAKKTDGTFWAWGDNSFGQLGDKTVVGKSSPIQIGALTDWSSVSAGKSHSLAYKTDGTIWAWGYNGTTSPLLGDNTVVAKSSPVKIGALTNWSGISAGYVHSLATKTDGTIWAWGYNGTTFPLLGDNTVVTKSSPVKIGALTDWLAVSAGGLHSLATKTDGTIWAWGLNANGQLGDSTFVSKSSPVKIGTLTDWASISAGASHSLAYKTDGTIWAWGRNDNGQLGDGTTTGESSPVKIGTLTDWANVSAGSLHSLARKTDGTIWGWGFDSFGQVGDNQTAVNISSPTKIGTLSDWTSISAGPASLSSTGLRLPNNLFVWGRNAVGQLGDNTTADKSSPIQIGASLNNKSSPVKIGTLTDWASVSAGGSHSLATKTDKTIWAWGLASSGQIGDSQTAANRSSPVKIGTLSDWAEVDAGAAHSIARKTDGTIWGWGLDSSGQVGDGQVAVNISSPTKIGTLSDWNSLSSGSSANHSFGIR